LKQQQVETTTGLNNNRLKQQQVERTRLKQKVKTTGFWVANPQKFFSSKRVCSAQQRSFHQGDKRLSLKHRALDNCSLHQPMYVSNKP